MDDFFDNELVYGYRIHSDLSSRGFSSKWSVSLFSHGSQFVLLLSRFFKSPGRTISTPSSLFRRFCVLLRICELVLYGHKNWHDPSTTSKNSYLHLPSLYT